MSNSAASAAGRLHAGLRQAPSSRLPIVALTLFVLFVAAAGLLAVALVGRTQLVQHTLAVQNSVTDLLASLQDAETGQRGYLLTGEDTYLEPYANAGAQIAAEFTSLLAETSDNPTQQAALAAMRLVVDAKLAELAETIRLHRAGDAAAALAIMRTDRGQDLMDKARAIIAGMRREEGLLLEKRAASAAWLSRALFAAVLASGVVAILFVALWVRGTVSYARVLELVRQDLSGANLALEARVAERTAELRETNEEIQRFAYIVSHDLRAPLVNIMGFTSEIEAAREDIRTELATSAKAAAIDADLGEALGFIRAAIVRMDGLIGAILKISRDGRRAFRPEPLDMTAVLQGLADAQRHQADAAGAVVIVAALPGVTADRLAVEQVFGNLIDNAIKYLDASRPGRIEITGQQAGSASVYRVEDNGRGIAAADHARVFELFRRAGAQDRQGDGIGLAHVKTLVRSIGGRIELASEAGRGTVFKVTLPRTPALV